jgi:hypothetical protein
MKIALFPLIFQLADDTWAWYQEPPILVSSLVIHQLLSPELLPSSYAIPPAYGFGAIPKHCPLFVLHHTIVRFLFYTSLRLLV